VLCDLRRFLNRVARHPQLNCDSDFVDFVEMDGELPKSSSTSSLSGAGLFRLFNRVGDSLGKYTSALPESDEVRLLFDMDQLYSYKLADYCDYAFTEWQQHT